MAAFARTRRSAALAWGPSTCNSSILAAGTKAGAVSDAFDSASCLELFQVDVSSADLQSLSCTEAPARFSKLAWSGWGADDGEARHGILAGGMDNGTITLYDAG
eukprot:3159546-Pleurochrysis_carterae.AAC.1